MTATLSAARRSRKVLLPMATLLAAASIAIASGATFSSSSANAASTYATGMLEQVNSKDAQAIFTGTNLKPGDTITGSVTIQNTGTLPATFSLNEVDAVNGFSDPSLLTMEITQGGSEVFAGTFGTVGTIDLGTFAAGESRTFTYSTTLDAATGNGDQGASATAAYRWDATQTAASTFDTTGSN